MDDNPARGKPKWATIETQGSQKKPWSTQRWAMVVHDRIQGNHYCEKHIFDQSKGAVAAVAQQVDTGSYDALGSP